MEIPKQYNPAECESHWYEFWMKNGYFNSVPDHREPYTIVIPPPNVTGVLHMGHMLNNTIQDVLIRRARMMGKNACWVPGTDHASIATEAKVVRKLREQGIRKGDLSRDAFLEHAWEWTNEHGGVILDQLKKLGASCDWDRTRFTLDDGYYKSVINTFVDLHNKGLIYRGARMINWDPAAKTALSDEEVIHKEEQSKLYHVRYLVEGTEDEWLTIATTRPETILGDTAICIHPEDERYRHLHGKKAIVPLIGRVIPIIQDEYVDMEFGTGCLKVTPAHDPNDYVLGEKHGLEVVDIMNEDGTLSGAAQLYIGEDRFAVRKKIAEDLQDAGNLIKVEEYTNKVGYSERTNVVIEPRLSMQWWVNMKSLAEPALKAVEEGEIGFFPEKFVNTYRHWMSNIRDWCISRQLWWGHRIPAYYYGENELVVAASQEEALQLARQKSGNSGLMVSDLKQEEDVLDTWFSSWLWPIAVFDGFESDEEVDYYYPTNDLVTGPDIIFFWVARMIMAGYHYRDERPFNNVYFTGIVRDAQGRKMSKQLGNSPDPIELMEEYGADGVRMGLLLTAPAGNDLPFDPKLCEQGRNFSNKIWNAFRLVKGWEVEQKEQPESAKQAIAWMNARFNATLLEIDESFERFRLSEALMNIYKLMWDDFCSWYLEMVKPPYGEAIDEDTYEATLGFFEGMLKLLHPFMPFISEEIWQRLDVRKDKRDALIVATWPAEGAVKKGLLDRFETAREVVSAIRNARKRSNIPHKQSLELHVKANQEISRDLDPVIAHLCNLSTIVYTDEKIDQALTFLVSGNEYFIPLSNDLVDVEQEIEKLEKELDYTRGFLQSVMKKLSNERFVGSAPEAVVAAERRKQSDAEEKIRMIEEKIGALK